jgi:hypothetical protein
MFMLYLTTYSLRIARMFFLACAWNGLGVAAH